MNFKEIVVLVTCVVALIALVLFIVHQLQRIADEDNWDGTDE